MIRLLWFASSRRVGGTEIVNVVCDRMRRGPRGRGWVIVEVLREASVFQLGELIIARTC